MPNYPAAKITYPGLLNIIGAVHSYANGETPGVCAIQCTPQEQPPDLTGELVITYGDEVLKFPNCRAVDASYQRDSRGRIVSLVVEDFRWKWRFGEISGRYNVRDAEGKVITHTERTPGKLAALCFIAMGHFNVDTSLMPDEPRPLINWDCDNPAQMLAALCDELGCVIAPDIDAKVWIVSRGNRSGNQIGGSLPGPEYDRTDIVDGLDPPEKPDGIMLVGGPVEFQHDFELEAVALEVTGDNAGEYVPMDDASYVPVGGWIASGTGNFNNITTLKDREAAEASIYRAYRIKIPQQQPDDGLNVPGYYKDSPFKLVKRHDQLILLDRQVDKDQRFGKSVNRPPWVYGSIPHPATIGNDAGTVGVSSPKPIVDPESDEAKLQLWRKGFTVDAERRVVVLSERATSKDAADHAIPAKLRLRIAVHVLDEETGEIFRYRRHRSYGTTIGTSDKIIRRDEITDRYVPTYDDNFSVTDVTNHPDHGELSKEADYYIDAQEQEWQTLKPASATYARIWTVQLTGSINHVVRTLGSGQAATTRVALNSEFKDYITPYKERRLRAQQLAAVQQQGQPQQGNMQPVLVPPQ